MAVQIESPAPRCSAETGLYETSLQDSLDGPENPTKSAPAQEVCCELIRDDLCAYIGPMIATLNVALAMRDAGDDFGLIYALRRAHAYWRAITASARDLKEAGQ